MTEHADDEARIAEYYRTDFAGPSLGTEEELDGTRIQMPIKASNMVGLIRHATSGQVLVLITRDVPRSLGTDVGTYTIELRTTPTEADDDAGWERRRRALQVAIWAINDNVGKPLKDDVYQAYQTEITNASHVIAEVPDGGVAKAGLQMTVGVPADQIGAATTALDRQRGILHRLLRLPWYQDEFTADAAVAGLSDREKIGYALVMSAILKLAEIWTRHPGKVDLLDVKNEWVVRPRKPPANILDSFDQEDDALAVTAAITTATLPAWANTKVSTPVDGTWAMARDYIAASHRMGGHPPPFATINGIEALLFEYRHAQAADYPHAFWDKRERFNFDQDI